MGLFDWMKAVFGNEAARLEENVLQGLRSPPLGTGCDSMTSCAKCGKQTTPYGGGPVVAESPHGLRDYMATIALYCPKCDVTICADCGRLRPGQNWFCPFCGDVIDKARQ